MTDIIERGNHVETLAQALRSIGPGRLLTVGGVLFALIAFFVIFVARFTSPSMEELYSQLDQSDTQRVITQLSTMGIHYELKKAGGQIMVPGEDVARIRMQLADQGLPGSGVIGYEIFDKADSLGTTDFLQNVTYIRALEGELGRTVESLNIVKGARVHLVLPKRELFSRERRQPSASVFLRMQSAVRLNSEQVSAIQHLIAAAVPSLLPSRISIIDNKGKLLAAGFEDGSEGAVNAKADEKQRALELRLSRTIEELLERTVGFGKVRAEVHAEMDFDRISTQEETYDPDAQVVGSTQSVEENSGSTESDGANNVSVGTNLPDANFDSADSQSSKSNAARTEETTNFLNSKKVVNHIRQVGLLTRLTVAVLVDGTRILNEDTGAMDFVPIEQGKLELLENLTRNIVGYNPDRGDQIDIINLEFAEFEEPEQELTLIFGLEKNDLYRFAQLVVLAIVALLVIMLVVRPLISRAFEASQSAAQAASERMLADQAIGAPALAGPGARGVPAPTDDDEDEEQFEELIDIDRVEGRVKASSVKKVGEIVEKHPEEAISIIRAWMYQEQ